MNKRILAASSGVREPIHLLAATVVGAGLLAALSIAAAIASL